MVERKSGHIALLRKDSIDVVYDTRTTLRVFVFLLLSAVSKASLARAIAFLSID